MSKHITLEDLGLTKEEMDTFHKGSHHLFGSKHEDTDPEADTKSRAGARKHEEPEEGGGKQD